MLIDWFTVGAQALNFLLLVWLMKRFLYQPILNAIDARETLIAKKLADAHSQQTLAKQERTEFEQKNAQFEQERAKRQSEMCEALKTEQERLLKEASQAADDLTNKRMAALQNEAQTLSLTLRQQTKEEVFAITRKTLSELASAELEQAIVKIFCTQLSALTDGAKTKLAHALSGADKALTTSKPAIVRSAFALPQDQQCIIQKSLNEAFHADIALCFETSPQLVSGLVLLANGEKLAWSIDSYLHEMEQNMTHLISAQQKPKDTAQTKTKNQNKAESQASSDITLSAKEK